MSIVRKLVTVVRFFKRKPVSKITEPGRRVVVGPCTEAAPEYVGDDVVRFGLPDPSEWWLDSRRQQARWARGA